MAATLGRGYSFGSTETVTNTKLHTLVDSGTVTGIAQADLAAGQGLVNIGTSAPSDTDQVWVDTGSTPVTLRFYNSSLSLWVPATNQYLYTNKSGQTGSAGRVLILDTSNSNGYTYTSTSGDTKFLGIETGSIANNATAPVVTIGSTIVLLTVSASAGTYIRTATATGKADPVVNSAAGVFGFLTEAGTASARAHIFGTDPNGTLDQTANYSWTGTHSFSSTITINTASATTTNWKPTIQCVFTSYSASASGTTTIPYDDSIPQNTEGDEYMSQAITPKSASNILVVEAEVQLMTSASGTNYYIVGLFQDSTANALSTAWTFAASNASGRVRLCYQASAGTTSSTTFKVRAGINSAGTTTFNSNGTTRLFGGQPLSYIRITEIKA